MARWDGDPASGGTAGRVGQAVVTLLALALLAVTPALWRATAPLSPRRARR